MPEFSTQLLAYGFVWYVAFLFSTTCHEAAHALVAKLGGDETAALGRTSHAEPTASHPARAMGHGGVPDSILFVFKSGMIGWASAPFDPQWERRHPTPRRVDGAGRAGGKLYVDAAGGYRFTLGTEHGLAAKEPGNRAAKLSGGCNCLYFSP